MIAQYDIENLRNNYKTLTIWFCFSRNLTIHFKSIPIFPVLILTHNLVKIFKFKVQNINQSFKVLNLNDYNVNSKLMNDKSNIKT